jgi:hypothetical protein
MINTIITEINKGLQTVNITDLICGIVKPIKRKIRKGNDTVEKTEPGYLDITAKTNCNVSDYISCVPNSAKRSILYYELESNNIEQLNSHTFRVTSQVKLIFWFNYKKINTDIQTIDSIQLALIKAIPDRLTINNIQHISIQLTGSEKAERLFSDYDYDETEKQFLMYPYDYFALNYTIEYSINKACIEDITKKEAQC